MKELPAAFKDNARPSAKTRIIETLAGVMADSAYLTRPIQMREKHQHVFLFEILCDTRPLPSFTAGQSLPVSFPGEGILSKARLLAPVSSPAQQERMVFCLDDCDDWALALRTRLEGIAFEGMKPLHTRLGRATGSFCLKMGTGPLRHVFIAGGMGAAPIFSMLESIRGRERNEGRVLFIWAAEIRDQLFGLDSIESVLSLIEGAHFVPVLSHDPLWRGERGDLDTALLERIVPAHFGMKADRFEWALPSWYISAEPEQLKELRRFLRQKGALAQAIHTTSGRL